MIISDSEFTWYNFRHNPTFDVVELPYGAFYYEPLSNSYYHADMQIIQDVTYTLDPEKQVEQKLNRYPKHKNEKLLYVGSISPTQRIYYHPEFDKTYIKTLTLYIPSNYKILQYPEPDLTKTLTSPIYPYLKPYKDKDKKDTYTLYFTNEQGVFHPPSKNIDGSICLLKED